MANVGLEDFEEPFDPSNFVERTAANVHGGGTKGGSDAFDPGKLKEHFEDMIGQLNLLMKETEMRISSLETVCKEEDKKRKVNVSVVEQGYETSMSKFHDLDDRINYVATKVVHLGDQLENISTPRQKMQEAQQIMKYFEEFHSGKVVSPIFNNPEKLHEAASIIHKLHTVASELPFERFSEVKRSIAEQHESVEKKLRQEFKNAYRRGSIDDMAKCAHTLQPFGDYKKCYEELINMSMSEYFHSGDLFNDIIPACNQVQEIVSKVFENTSEMIMSKFIQAIFDTKVQGYVYKQLRYKSEDVENYLKTLAHLYGRIKEIMKKLSEFRLGSDSTFLDRLKKTVFQKYLSAYISDELGYLESRSKTICDAFYMSISHQKKEKSAQSIVPIMSDQMQAQLQELQKRIPGRTKQGLKENLLSQDVAVNLLQENKVAIRRCEMLSSPSELPSNVSKIFEILIKYLGEEHFEYAVEMTLQALPLSDPKSDPDLLFLNLLHEANAIFHLMEKHFTDYVLRLVGSSPVYSKCAQKKKDLIDKLEAKLDQGMEKVLSSILARVKFILSNEQKKTDYKTDNTETVFYTQACRLSCQYITRVLPFLRDSLDGKNLEAVLTEFGVRFHRQLLDHLHQFSYTSIGAMVALCDINEYRLCIKSFKLPLLDGIFRTLYALVDLLIVKPENIKEVCTSEQFTGLEKSVLHQFIQLRADYKTAKLSKIMIQ